MWLILLKNFGGFFFKNWKIFAIVLPLLGGYMYYKHMVNEIESLKNDKIFLTNELSKCKDAIAKQNGEIEFWANKGREEAKKFSDLQAKLNQTKKDTAKQIEDIMNDKNKPKTCEEAIQYLIDGRKDL